MSQMSKDQIEQIKSDLAVAVEEKKQITRKRLALKQIRFKDRTAEQHREMLSLFGDAYDKKQEIRVLQLAYAYARGRAYWTQERHSVFGATSGTLAGEMSRILPVQAQELLLWIMAPVDDLARAAFAAHEQACRERAFAARAERTKARAVAAE